MISPRKKTRQIEVGSLKIGGDAPIVVQSMTNTDTGNTEATLAQIQRLADAGCEMIRVAVPNESVLPSLALICQKSPIPVVADIHFDYRLALSAIDAGIAKLRLNPGNIGDRAKIEQVVAKAKERNIPIRIGVNGGSLEHDILEKYNDHATPEAMVESAMRHVKILEELDFTNIALSVKASDVPRTIAAYRLLSEKVDYPLHLGVTEAGTVRSGGIKSAIGLGTLLAEGIGDTLRVSLTGDPIEEVRLAWEILEDLGIRSRYRRFTSCPTCGRTGVDLVKIATEVEERTSHLPAGISVAVMGCEVNGPGEAAEADFGIIGGKGRVAIFRKGKFIESVEEERAVERFLVIVEQTLDERNGSL